MPKKRNRKKKINKVAANTLGSGLLGRAAKAFTGRNESINEQIDRQTR